MVKGREDQTFCNPTSHNYTNYTYMLLLLHIGNRPHATEYKRKVHYNVHNTEAEGTYTMCESVYNGSIIATHEWLNHAVWLLHGLTKLSCNQLNFHFLQLPILVNGSLHHAFLVFLTTPTI